MNILLSGIVHQEPRRATKRSVLTDGSGIPLGVVVAPANCHDSPLLRPTLEELHRLRCDPLEQITVHLDAGYDSAKTRDLLTELGCDAVISAKGSRYKRAAAGRSSGPTPGTTAASASSWSAPKSADE